MVIQIMNYTTELLKSIQCTDSVFQDGNQRSVYSICDISETHSCYVVSFYPSDEKQESVTFEFLGNNMFITGEKPENFNIAVSSSVQPIKALQKNPTCTVEALYKNGILQIFLPKRNCKHLESLRTPL